MHEKENILDILKKAKEALAEENSFLMKDLSDRTVHSASIYQDPDNIAIAVLIYSLSKIIERRKYRTYKDWKKFIAHNSKVIKKLIAALEQDNEILFKEEIQHLRRHIDTLSEDFRQQIQSVFRRAEVNKASKIYEHGISMQRTANLLGITVWELAEYAGGTGMNGGKLSITLPEVERIKKAWEMFK